MGFQSLKIGEDHKFSNTSSQSEPGGPPQRGVKKSMEWEWLTRPGQENMGKTFGTSRNPPKGPNKQCLDQASVEGKKCGSRSQNT